DHGKHDFYVADCAGAENGAQLRFEEVDVLKAKTDSTPAKERVQLVGDIHCAWREFVAPKIKCSDNQRIGPDALRDFSIRFQLFVFRWQGTAIQIKELRAIESDPLCTVGRNGLNVFREFDIC